jgi:ribonuclease E
LEFKMNILLINASLNPQLKASQPEEIRVALVAQNKQNSKNKLLDLYIENTLQKKTTLNNIYAGIIESIDSGLEAAFIKYDTERHGFLPFREIAVNYYKEGDSQQIKQALRIGQRLMVQIKKEERVTKRGTKRAALTTYISLPGSYLVLMPNNPEGGGVSRQIEGIDRREMQDILKQLTLPEGMGLILRTASVGKNAQDLETDLTLLLQKWEAINQAFNSKSKSAPFLIFQEGDIIARTIRDYLRGEIDEIVVDEEEVFNETKTCLTQIRPDLLSHLRLSQESKPLFLHPDIEDEVESAFQPRVRLPSGGNIVFDRCEGIVAIDVNSGGATRHKDIEETALKTNLEAAQTIPEQIRWRDLGGLIVIDFIDMLKDSHRRQVEERFREAFQPDRARVQIGSIIPKFGVLVMSRQLLRASLGKVNEDLCPYCQGHGTRRSIESLALAVLRAIQNQILRKSIRQVRVELSVDLATYLGNEKRAVIVQLEQLYQVTILLLINRYWESARYKITTLSPNELVAQTDDQLVSYALLADKPEETVMGVSPIMSIEKPAVQCFSTQETVVGKSAATDNAGLLKRGLNRLSAWFRSIYPKNNNTQKTEEQPPRKPRRRIKRHSPSTIEYRGRPRVNTNRRMRTNKRITQPLITDQADVAQLSPNGEPSFQTKKVKNTVETVHVRTEEASGEAPTLQTTVKSDDIMAPAQTLRPRATVRRFGGEPKVRNRSYTNR